MHLTDPHLFADFSGELRGTNTAESLQRVLNHYNAGDWRASRALITGDLIQDDSAEAYNVFRNLLLPLNMRMHCIPGNHDVRALMKKACSRPPFSYCAKEEVGNWLIIGLDSCVSGEAGGAVSAEELQRLDDAVASSSAEHVLVHLHHPPVAMGSRWLDTVLLKDREHFLRRVRASGRVRLVLFGHVHQPFEEEQDGMKIIGTPSTCSQFEPGSDDFAIDDSPPAYRRLTLRNDGSVDDALVWVDA